MRTPARTVDSETSTRSGDRWAHYVGRNILWLLVGCYALAAICPRPGIALRKWEWSPGGIPVSVSLLLLAVMLFIAALSTDTVQIRSVLQKPLVPVVGLVAIWLAPAIVVILAGWAVPWAVDGQQTAGLMVGLALVAAMPVANSTVGWTQTAGGSLALSLSLVVVSILLSPWVTPSLLTWLGMSLSPSEQEFCERLVTSFSGLFFICWVLLPTAAGFAARYLFSPAALARSSGWRTIASASALLGLNYVNTAVALPRVVESPALLLAATATLAIALSAVGLACGWAIARFFRLSDESRAALVFGLSMKHTGLALILAGGVLGDQPLAILIIILATLMQHLLAGLAQSWMK
jgi:BASS family bile acid:Na+ symporter